MSSNITRFNVPVDPRNPQDHIDTGFEGKTSDVFTIPSCEIEDADISLFNLFNKDLGLVETQVNGSSGPVEIKKPYVIFATGERFAVVKKLRPPRDRNKALMLPAISIRRKSFSQTDEDMASRGMNQHTGNLVIKRKLDSSDRDYQLLINKLLLKNVDLLPTSTREGVGQYRSTLSEATKEGALLDPHFGNNIWEIITIPQPQFYTATYEIVFWTSYTEHMNYLIQTLMNAQLPQGKMFKLVSDKGYWFIAYRDDEVSSQDNIDDFKEQERILRYSFTITVKGFLLAYQGPGNPVPIRRHISAPVLHFELETAPEQVITKNQAPVDQGQFILSDIQQDPEKAQTTTTEQNFLVKKDFLSSRGKKVTKYVKIIERNQKKGETVYSTSAVTSLEDFLLTIK